MDKVIRDDKVAVLYGTEWGGNWYTDHYVEELLYCPRLVELVEQFQEKVKETSLPSTYPGVQAYYSDWIRTEIQSRFIEYEYKDYIDVSTVKNLDVEWVTVGPIFTVCEYDGKESVVLQEGFRWHTA